MAEIENGKEQRFQFCFSSFLLNYLLRRSHSLRSLLGKGLFYSIFILIPGESYTVQLYKPENLLIPKKNTFILNFVLCSTRSFGHCPNYLSVLLYQFTFAQNRPKSDISGALRPIHYITLKAFAMASGDGTKCKTCFGGPRMILHAQYKNPFPK